ncbi:PREDICTED: oxidative stress-induced growth inhibitor 2-like [Priapulus caudatus]|uniref:Oxidative stress-induced growth inhibitor 2-like n=1 Tax=Priapulus caudatus TaxID=37621 RepID=A0ABM1E4X6_PRICU|nr:PREDICTED: oxidative stress-induced growth inhibitor 2-like [Priapulus caudatus]XP_014667256.1 PREDICTED: oxidative stress-induced growth inhibitor 2-like [Priapulus caudatus]XP_014667266.1 PREDICTED: oxidative stress-induced growth inhibitor 2-like [Priapulus caudatus]
MKADKRIENDLGCKPQTTGVVIVGNGPAGISLSYQLAGNRPYFKGRSHHDDILNLKLQEKLKVSLVDQDIEYLSEGLEGRSSNPVALLFDTLARPMADLGQDHETHLSWKYESSEAIPHVVLGRGPPGGAWQMMKGEMLTLSLGSWMELPDCSFKQFLHKLHVANSSGRPRSGTMTGMPPPGVVPSVNRASVADVASYYQHYVRANKLEPFFRDACTVTSVRRLPARGHHVYDCESGELETDGCWEEEKGEDEEDEEEEGEEPLWEVRGFEDRGSGAVMPFCYHAANVVLATGTFDRQNRLAVDGESCAIVHHSVAELGALLASGDLARDPNPVLIVGAGLSAADAVLAALERGVRVLHAFRRDARDRELVFARLPTALYPEYHRVHAMMRGDEAAAAGGGYRAFARHRVHSIRDDGRVVLASVDGEMFTTVRTSRVVVLVGSAPDLAFMPSGGRHLGVHADQPIDGKRNRFDADCVTYESAKERGLFAMGALVGDTFVRFIVGGALGIAATLARRRKLLAAER